MNSLVPAYDISFINLIFYQIWDLFPLPLPVGAPSDMRTGAVAVYDRDEFAHGGRRPVAHCDYFGTPLRSSLCGRILYPLTFESRSQFLRRWNRVDGHHRCCTPLMPVSTVQHKCLFDTPHPLTPEQIVLDEFNVQASTSHKYNIGQIINKRCLPRFGRVNWIS